VGAALTTLRGTEQLDGSIGEGFDEYLFYLVTQVQSRRVRNFTPALDALGLSIAHWRALSAINRLGGCLMSELAEFTTVDRTTLTRTVDQLVDCGLVMRSTSADDRRLVRVDLTEQGRSVFAMAMDALVQQHEQTLKGLDPQELRMLRSLLQRILRNLVPNDALFSQVLNFKR
jgi:DNA-binding MarR family transcriptional regulator